VYGPGQPSRLQLWPQMAKSFLLCVHAAPNSQEFSDPLLTPGLANRRQWEDCLDTHYTEPTASPGYFQTLTLPPKAQSPRVRKPRPPVEAEVVLGLPADSLQQLLGTLGDQH
jgi:hypothetical protein